MDTKDSPVGHWISRLARAGMLFSACLGVCAFAFAQDAKLATAESAISARIAKSGADVAVYFRTLDGRAQWSARADDLFHAASTMKIPVMIELFHQVQEGKVKLTDTLLVKNEFHSIVDGSPYVLNASDDSEGELYKAEGQKRTLRELCEVMIKVSSNLAANLLIEKLGVENIRAEVLSLGADGMNVKRGVEDGKAFEKGLNNTTTARSLGILLQAIAEGKAVDAASSNEMVAILEWQKFNEGIPAGLPKGIPVAHKTGEITKIHHDAAIVFAKRPFILVILVRGLAEKMDSAALMAEVSKSLYEALE
ncbi:MAG TPA: serine hydrolase [Candidatus Acidoferrum sp.]|nr:serine hydrolase [Candidatus Acidoferrum sp.]